MCDWYVCFSRCASLSSFCVSLTQFPHFVSICSVVCLQYNICSSFGSFHNLRFILFRFVFMSIADIDTFAHCLASKLFVVERWQKASAQRIVYSSKQLLTVGNCLSILGRRHPHPHTHTHVYLLFLFSVCQQGLVGFVLQLLLSS